MHYLVAQGIIFCRAVAFRPSPPFHWTSGDLIRFTIPHDDSFPMLKFASLLAADGSGWGVELDFRHPWAVGAKGFELTARVMHRITKNQSAQDAVIRLAKRLGDGLVELIPAHYPSETEIESISRTIVEAGGRPVIYGNAGAPHEGIYHGDRIVWSRLRKTE